MPDTKKKIDIYKTQNSLANSIKRIKRDDTLLPEHKELILKFETDLLARGVSAKRRRKVVLSLPVLLRKISKPLEGLTNGELKELVAWINSGGDKDWSETTKEDYKALLKTAWKIANGYEREDKPKEIRFLKSHKIVTPPKWFVSPELADKAIDNCFNSRDKFIISALYEGGFRTGELVYMKLSDWRIDGPLLEARVPDEGKTGERFVYLHNCIPYYKRWIEDHPDRNNPDAPLIMALYGKHKGERINPFALIKLVKTAFKRADAPHTVTIQTLRKTNSSQMSEKLSSAQLCDRQGWVQGSRMPGFYVGYNKKRRKQMAKELYGVTDEALPNEKPRTISCINPLCGEVNPANQTFCYKCHTPLTTEAAEKVKQVREQIAQDQKLFYESGDIGKVLLQIRARLELLEANK